MDSRQAYSGSTTELPEPIPAPDPNSDLYSSELRVSAAVERSSVSHCSRILGE